MCQQTTVMDDLPWQPPLPLTNCVLYSVEIVFAPESLASVALAFLITHTTSSLPNVPKYWKLAGLTFATSLANIAYFSFPANLAQADYYRVNIILAIV